MIKIISISVFALFLILLAGQSVFACKCSNPPTVEQSFEQSAAVFYGTVEEIDVYDEKTAHARLKIEKSWKGADKDETLVATDTTSCGIDFKIGESYYLFVDRDGNAPNAYRVVPCRRHAGRQEEFLKDKPTLQLISIRRGANNLLRLAAGITGSIVVLAAIAIAVGTFIRRRRLAN